MRQVPLIVCVGGADTGRAPIMAALLRRMLDAAAREMRIESAGVLGHDGAPAQVEARDALAVLGLDLGQHEARSLGDKLARAASLLLTPDSGTLLVLRARLGEGGPPMASLAELAGTQRDIPDPFRMQVGAWLSYAREMEALLRAALPRIVALLDEARPAEGATQAQQDREGPAALTRLLAALREFPELFDWTPTRLRIEREIELVAGSALGPPYVALLRALLAMTPSPPTAGQAAALYDAGTRYTRGPSQDDLNTLSALIARWPFL
jgi:protein-tyrosine-phosphatase